MLKSNSKSKRMRFLDAYGDFLRASLVNEAVRSYEDKSFRKIQKEAEGVMHLNGLNIDVNEYLLMDYYKYYRPEKNKC